MALGLAAASPLAAQTRTPLTTANDPSRGGWGETERPVDQEAVEASRGSIKPKGGFLGGGSFEFVFIPVGLIFVIARLVLAHILRNNGPKVEKIYDYHEPPVQKWRPPDPRTEARLRILEPEYIAPGPEAPAPIARPVRSFGKRGL
ncbi:hypothetical protein [Sphingomonas sp. Y38-1Y]|uniref:hypothetical protein n=1 Tax=Sphingomonas sp. Y38-1Y TaxID=3078265 RepID=UPI0028EDAE3E|nr:hypothetical protein [Sphingomonas sp. Y38-1Y]